MNKRLLLLAAFVISLVGTRAFAVPINFDFSFHDTQTGGNIAGVVSGLHDNGLNQAATSVFVTSNSLGYGVGEYVGSPQSNLFDVVNGFITSVEFLSFGVSNTAPEVVCCSLFLTQFSEPNGYAGGLSEASDYARANADSVITFTPRDETSVPIPAPIALIGLGLLGIHISRRRKPLLG